MYILQGAGIPTLGNNEVIIEYAEPIIKHSKRHKSNIKINRVYCIFKNTLLGQNDRDNCTIDVNCQFSELKERFAVGKIYSQSSYGTGTLLQNTANDGKLYFLTAKHTVDGILATGTTLSSVYVDFNYQSTSCNASTPTTPYFYTVKNIITSNSLTDFALLELDSYPEKAYLSLTIYDMQGRLVSKVFEGNDVQNGIYNNRTTNNRYLCSYIKYY